MLTLVVPEQEYWSEDEEEFLVKPEVSIDLEHSLVSISKWESIFEKPFLSGEKTREEVVAYIECMNLTPDVDPEVFQRLSDENYTQIHEHIEAKKTATWFSVPPSPGGQEVITSEVIYYWMIALNVPTEFQHWHLSRLLTLIKVCQEKNQSSQKKMSHGELLERNRKLNEERKRALGTRG